MPPRSDQEHTSTADDSLASFVDALFAYALDPAQWDHLFVELDRKSELIDRVDPNELLVSLSHAEALAWELKNESDVAGAPNYAFVLFDRNRRAIDGSENTAELAEFLHFDSGSQTLEFVDSDTHQALQDALSSVHLEGGHRLLEIRNQDHLSVYGYVVRRSAFPGGLIAAPDAAQTALLIPLDRPTEQIRQIVKSSFGLTTAEASVAYELAGGRSLKETAQALGVSVNTARNQLQAVFAKSGIRRQSDLILLVTQLSVLLAAITRRAVDQRNAHAQSPEHPPRRFVVLASGERLAFRRYGDGEHNVLFLHETIGCSRLPVSTSDLASQENLSILSPDRSGFGFSDALPAYSFETVARVLADLLDQLEIERVSLLGNFSGASIALVFASLHPERVDQVFCLSGRPPIQEAPSRLTALRALRQRLVQQPWLLNTVFNILRSRSSPQMNARTAKQIYGRSKPDRMAINEDPDVLEYIVGSTIESLTVTSSGVSGDLACFANAADFDLQTLTMPITAWHGAEDVIADPEALHNFLAPIQHDYKLIPDAGALLMLTRWRDVLAALGDLYR